MKKLSRRSWLKAVGSVLITPSAIIGGTLKKLSDRNSKPAVPIEEQVSVMNVPDGWYIQPLHEAWHPFDNLSKELAYRGFVDAINIPNKSGYGYRIGSNSIEEAMGKAQYLSGLYSSVLLVNIKDGRPWYQAIKVLTENEIPEDSKGLLGSPSGLEELVRQEGEFIKNDPSSKDSKIADWKLVLALIAAESSFDPDARGVKLSHVNYNGRYSFKKQHDGEGNPIYSGAIGLSQVKPEAGKDVGMTHEDLNHRRLNIRAGYRYLNSLIHQFGDERTALYAYNRGPGDTRRDIARRGLTYPESVNHMDKVMELYREARLEEARRQSTVGITA